MTCSSICGDGLVVGNETCDAGTLPGCNSQCTGALSAYNCTGGNATSATVCVLIPNVTTSPAKTTSSSNYSNIDTAA